MTDYTISNNPADFGCTEDTTAGRFPAEADAAMRIAEGSPASIPLPELRDVWVSFYEYLDTEGSFNEDGYSHRIIAQNGVVLFEIDYTNGAQQAPNIVPRPEVGILFRNDVRIETYIGSVTDTYRIRWYVDGSLVFDTGSATNANLNQGFPVALLVGGENYLNTNGVHAFSQVLVSDQDTRARKFKLLKPTADGNYTQWVGGHSVLSDGDLSSIAVSDAAGERVSCTTTPGADPGGTISSVSVIATVRASGASPNPSQVGGFLRVGTTDYDFATLTTLTSASPIQIIADWPVNPADSLSWEWSDLTGLEFGLRTVA